MILYLLIDGRALIDYKAKWQLFTTKEAAVRAANLLGAESSPFGGFVGFAEPGDTPGWAVQVQGGATDLTIIPVEVQS